MSSQQRCYYEVLGVSKTATLQEITKAYRKLAPEIHPDRNKHPNAEEQFKELGRAYEVLRNEETREIYDNYGFEGLQQQNGGPSNHNFRDARDIFAEIFKGFGFEGAQPRKNKGKSILHVLRLALEDLYNGVTKKMKITRHIVCKNCRGSGSRNGSATPSRCNSCNGKGVKDTIQSFGGGMMFRSQSICNDCRGEGKIIKPEDRCKECNAEKMVADSKVISVKIEPGTRDGEKIVLKNEADELIGGGEPGDVVISIQQMPHPIFKRAGVSDLVIEKEITVIDSLTGFDFVVEHLDGRKILVKHDAKKHGTIKPNDIKQIHNEGMPIKSSMKRKGNLYVKFNVTFPDKISGKTIKALKQLGLPSTPTVTPSAGYTTVHMNDFDPKKYEEERMETDDDDDDHENPRNHTTQCSQQ